MALTQSFLSCLLSLILRSYSASALRTRGGAFNSVVIVDVSNCCNDDIDLKDVTELSHEIVSFLQLTIIPILRKTSNPNAMSHGQRVPFGVMWRCVAIFMLGCSSGMCTKPLNDENALALPYNAFYDDFSLAWILASFGTLSCDTRLPLEPGSINIFN